MTLAPGAVASARHAKQCCPELFLRALVELGGRDMFSKGGDGSKHRDVPVVRCLHVGDSSTRKQVKPNRAGVFAGWFETRTMVLLCC